VLSSFGGAVKSSARVALLLQLSHSLTMPLFDVLTQHLTPGDGSRVTNQADSLSHSIEVNAIKVAAKSTSKGPLSLPLVDAKEAAAVGKAGLSTSLPCLGSNDWSGTCWLYATSSPQNYCEYYLRDSSQVYFSCSLAECSL
jgi:hypothetical protein